MSASLIVLIPLVLLGLVTALCFVGCTLSRIATGPDLGPYQNALLMNGDLVAFWPLDDASETPTNPVGATAADIGPNKFNGTYNGSTVNVQRPGIVPGDTGPFTFCAFFNGGFVQVGFHPEVNPNGSFSIEAWVQVENMPNPPAVMVVAASNDAVNFTGYQLHATAENTWAASVGLSPGPGSQFLIAKPPMGSAPTVVPGVPTYLVATFDGNTLQLFVNGQPSAQNSIMAGMPSFAPATSPTIFSIGALGPDGAQPFNGEIQDVAFYGTALDQGTIMNHFNLGMGLP
jgi:Concanavalin A-like lectin/glucanases superfamily